MRGDYRNLGKKTTEQFLKVSVFTTVNSDLEVLYHDKMRLLEINNSWMIYCQGRDLRNSYDSVN